MTQMTPAQIREQAMAMLAQADEAEAAAPPATEPEFSPEDYRVWLFAQAETIEDPLEAWALVGDSWDELDGNETLQLISLLWPRFTQDVDGVVDNVPLVDQEALARRAAVQALEALERTTENFSALELFALRGGMPMETILEGREAAAAEAEPAPVGHPALANRLQAVATEPAAQAPVEVPPLPRDEAIPRGMKPKLRPDQRAPQPAAVPQADGSKVVLNQPLKTSAPRQRSGHNIPPQHAQYRRGSDGRMVPVDQVPDPT